MSNDITSVPVVAGVGARRICRRWLGAAAAVAVVVASGLGADHARADDFGPKSVAPLAKKLSDAVVNISTTQTLKGDNGVPLPKVPKGSPFEEFFEDFFKDPKGGSRSGRKVSSLGSGFVIDGKEGLIVTNNHVIDGADEIVINFHDGSKLTVEKVVGRDTKSDLALLKVKPEKPLIDVAFGSSDALEVGDWVLAIGNPFGLGGSVSVGIISAKSRDINSGLYDDYLQTDAAINKGNSGGPLFNMKGEVIGVNTAIISPTGGSIGIGFAVPSTTAALIIKQLKEFGATQRGWLGVRIQTVTEDIAASAGLNAPAGAMISALIPDGPAAKAGLKAGDIILQFDGKSVDSARALPKIVARSEVGQPVSVDVVGTDKGRRTVELLIGLQPEDEDAPVPTPAVQTKPQPSPPGDEATLLGLKVSRLTAELRAKYNLGKTVNGVVVEDVDPASAAALKGLKQGDVIAEAGQIVVGGPNDMAKGIEQMRKAGRRAVLLRVEDSRGDVRFVAVPLS